MSQELNRYYTALKHGWYQRTLHYHNTPERFRELYLRQLHYIREHFRTITPKAAADRLLQKGGSAEKDWVIGAFDGYRNHYEVLYPILEELGLHGWFLLVTDFLDVPVKEQEKSLTTYRMQYLLHEYPDGRYAMNWEEAKEIGENHTIVNHSCTHFSLAEDTDEKILHEEIRRSHGRILEKTKIRPQVFSYLGGADMGLNPKAADLLKEMDYHFLIGYQLEYFEKENPLPVYETPDLKEPWFGYEPGELKEQAEYYDSVIEGIGWFSAVPAILPFTRCGYVDLGRKDEAGEKLAGHFAALAVWLMRHRNLPEKDAANRAMEILAFWEIGKEFPYH